MSKFSGSSAPSLKAKGPIQVTENLTRTYNYASAFTPEHKSELFLLAVTNFVKEDRYYETAGARDSRFVNLVRAVTVADPEFVENLVPYVRNTANMRSCAVVMAAQYALAGGPNRRQVVNSAMSRADDIGEFIGYWFSQKGNKTFPGGVQRGLADAAKRLYGDYDILKYDTPTKGIRMGDVLNLVHPRMDPAVGKYIIDRRYGNEITTQPEMVASREHLMKVDEKERRKYAKEYPEQLSAAGVTWEFLSSWIPGGMDAEAWELAIPNMGYMALLRNLRNFEDANISKDSAKYVAGVIANPERVAKSRQLPFRFFSAYREVGTDLYTQALAFALEESTKNIPEFDGRTIVFVDLSGSMMSPLTAKSKVLLTEVGALFGASLYAKNPTNTRVILFASRSAEATPAHRMSALKYMTEMTAFGHRLGGGTELYGAVRDHYKDEDRIVVFTDMQINPGSMGTRKPKFVHSFDLSGYGKVPTEFTGNGRYLYAGFTDNTMSLMNILEKGTSQSWDDLIPKAPWKIDA